jgi:hypothetical protein
MRRIVVGAVAYLVPTFALGFVWHLVLRSSRPARRREATAHPQRMPCDESGPKLGQSARSRQRWRPDLTPQRGMRR